MAAPTPSADEPSDALPFVSVPSWQEWILRVGVTLLTLAAVWSVFGEDLVQLAAPTSDAGRPVVRALPAAAPAEPPAKPL